MGGISVVVIRSFLGVGVVLAWLPEHESLRARWGQHSHTGSLITLTIFEGQKYQSGFHWCFFTTIA